MSSDSEQRLVRQQLIDSRKSALQTPLPFQNSTSLINYLKEGESQSGTLLYIFQCK